MSTHVAGLRSWASRASGMRNVRIAGVAILITAAIAVSAILQGDVPEVLQSGSFWVRHVLHRYTYLAGYGLLYIEESGIPLPAPGDIFVMYVGAHVPRNLASWVVAWLGLIGVVVLGATNLFFISRKFGRRLVQSRYAEAIHLSPARLRKAELWFQRYGVVAIIFGRHIPGFRVPITVAAGALKVGYPTFAASVAVSTAIWAGIVMAIGVNFGPRMEAFLNVHRVTYWVWAGIVLIMIGVIVYRIQQAGPAAERAA